MQLSAYYQRWPFYDKFDFAGASDAPSHLRLWSAHPEPLVAVVAGPKMHGCTFSHSNADYSLKRILKENPLPKYVTDGVLSGFHFHVCSDCWEWHNDVEWLNSKTIIGFLQKPIRLHYRECSWVLVTRLFRELLWVYIEARSPTCRINDQLMSWKVLSDQMPGPGKQAEKHTPFVTRLFSIYTSSLGTLR